MIRKPLLIAGLVAAYASPARADDTVYTVSDLPGEVVLNDHDPDRPCIEDATDVVGYRQCPRYGRWGENLLEPEVFVQVGMTFRHFAGTPKISSADLSNASKRTTSGGTVKNGPGNTAWLFDERIGTPIAGALYTAFDFELGNFDPERTDDRGFVVDGMISLGLSGSIGAITLGGEVAGGVMRSSFPAEVDEHTSALLEARARGELWIAPWVTLGGAAGTSLLDRGDWMFGLYLGVHTWAYAGSRQ
jgi:hypothetical protein